MKRSMFISILVALLIVSMLVSAGCGSSASKKQEKVVLKLAHALPVTHHLAKAMDNLAKKANEKSNGSLEIQVFPAGQLHNDKSINDAVMTGSIDLGSNSMAMWASVIPAMEIFDVPFLFPSYEMAKKVIDGGVGELLSKEMEKKGAKALIWSEYGFVHFCNNKRPLKTPEDFKGLKLRSYGELPSETIKALGAAPVTMSSSEVYMAIQRGTVDGMTSGTTAMLERKMHEVNKYLTITNHAYPVHVVAINLNRWNGLSEEHRKILQEIAVEITEEIRANTKAEDERCLKELEKNGMEVYIVPLSEIESWKKATEGVQSIYIQRAGAVGQQVIEICKKALKED